MEGRAILTEDTPKGERKAANVVTSRTIFLVPALSTLIASVIVTLNRELLNLDRSFQITQSDFLVNFVWQNWRSRFLDHWGPKKIVDTKRFQKNSQFLPGSHFSERPFDIIRARMSKREFFRFICLFERQGDWVRTFLTRLNEYHLRVVIQESETLKEV